MGSGWANPGLKDSYPQSLVNIEENNMAGMSRVPGLAAVLLLCFGLISEAFAVNSGCAELVDEGFMELVDPPAGLPKVQCAAFFPFAVTTDGSESARLELRVEHEGLTTVSVSNTFPVVGVSVEGELLPQTGGFIELFDDGSHGDRLADDGIWSRDGFRVDAPPVPNLFTYDFDILRYTDSSGTNQISFQALGSNGQYGPAGLGRLDPALQTNAESIGGGFLVTENVVFIIDEAVHKELRRLLQPGGPLTDIGLVTKKFYERFPDDFDFILLMPGSYVGGGLRGSRLAGYNDIEGIGSNLYDNTAFWGSDGNLQSVFTLNLTHAGPVIHEISHHWGIFLGGELGLQQCAPAHVGLIGAGCGPLGGFDGDSLVDNGDGTYTISSTCFALGGAAADTTAMNPLNLYLTGLIPPEEVPDIPVPVNAQCNSISFNYSTQTATFAADGITMVSIGDIIAEAGPRVPNHLASQREFSLAWVVPMNRVPTSTEAGWFQHRAQYIGRDEPGDVPFRLTFKDATGGRATLNTIIPGFGMSVFGDGFESQN